MGLFKKKKPYKILDNFHILADSYSESPFGHHKNATDSNKEEYFMQWIFPLKLQRLALRTATGFRFIYLYAKDLWNNKLAIKIPKEKEKGDSISKLLISHLQSIRWFREMEKLSAYEREQGEAILMMYSNDEGDIDKYAEPLDLNKPILKVEAFSPIRYHIRGFDAKGNVRLYRIEVLSTGGWRQTRYVDVHPSRVIRKCADNLEYRFTGYSDLAAIADPITVLSTILKACGEAAFRWGTGHPVFFVKDMVDDTDLTKLKDLLGDVTRANWHAVPVEKIDRIEMLGQAGSMLNLKALADICIDQVAIGSGFPKPILLGEVAGVMGSEVTERSYFAKLDRDHTDLDPFVRKYFARDINVRKILNHINYYEIDWGIREVFNKMDAIDYDQKKCSVALAMMDFCSMNEVRKFLEMDPLPDKDEGDWIKGMQPYYDFQWNMVIQMAELQAQKEMAEQKSSAESQGTTSAKEKGKSTNKQGSSLKEIEKNKRVAPVTRNDMTDSLKIRKLKGNLKDNILNLRKNYSINKLVQEMGIYQKTIEKMEKWANETPKI